MSGKGDKRRPYNMAKWEKGYNMAFLPGKKRRTRNKTSNQPPSAGKE